MSAFGASVGRAVGGLGGPATTTILVVAGVAAGALGGGLYAGGAFSGGGQPAGAAGKLSVYPCPDTGPVIATVQAGQQVLATGRSEDSTWLRIHFPAPGRTEAWVEAGPLTVDGSVASLPIASCEPELAIAPPSSDLPEESLTAVLASPPATATPTPAPTATVGPTAGPTATPNSRPTVASLTASTRQISFDTARYCPTAVKRVTFRVTATDKGGVAGVTLFWREPGAAAFAQLPMNRVAGTAANGTWEATLDTAANGIDKAGSLAYYAVARDAAGVTRRIPATGNDTIQVKVCVNTGPTIAATSSAGNTLFWNPLGTSDGNCQTASNIVATIKDSDGVASATLFYRRPGDGTYQSKPMNNTTVKGKWYANLDSLGDKITVQSPPTDQLRWYIRATDSKAKATNQDPRTMTIRRCDSEADLSTNGPQPIPMCPSRPTWFYASASDPDGINGSSAVLSYTYVRSNGTKRTVVVPMPGNNDGKWYYSVSVQPTLAGWAMTGNTTVTWYVQTTDQWGGKTNAPGSSTRVTNC